MVTATSDSLLLDTATRFDLPCVADTAVAFVTDSTVCAQAAYAHAVAGRQDTTRPSPVYVLRVGSTRCFAFNGVRTGEFMSLPRFSRRVSDRTYAASCTCASYSAGFRYPSVEWRRRRLYQISM
jgi:hypothetical protein